MEDLNNTDSKRGVLVKETVLLNSTELPVKEELASISIAPFSIATALFLHKINIMVNGKLQGYMSKFEDGPAYTEEEKSR